MPKPDAIGRCELCGLVDHHLIAAVCPKCRKEHGMEPQADIAKITLDRYRAKAKHPSTAFRSPVPAAKGGAA